MLLYYSTDGFRTYRNNTVSSFCIKEKDKILKDKAGLTVWEIRLPVTEIYSLKKLMYENTVILSIF